MNVKTAQELAQECKASAISRGLTYLYAYYRTGSAVGVWDEAGQRWVAVLEKTIVPSFPWVRSEMEYLVNGEPAYKQDQWVAV